MSLSFFSDHFLRKILIFSVVQVTVEYHMENGACVPVRVHTIVISVQHSDRIELEAIRKHLLEDIIKVSGFVSRALHGSEFHYSASYQIAINELPLISLIWTPEMWPPPLFRPL